MVKIDFVNAQEPAINDTNLNQMQLNIENAINAQVSGDTLPVGCIVPFTSDTVPENWLLCDGQAVSRTDYALLFSIIGTSYGVGDGSTTFNLPNLKGRVVVGKDSTQTEFDNLGETGGEKTHTLTIDEMPSHGHNIIDAGNGAVRPLGYGESNQHTGIVRTDANVNWTDHVFRASSTGGGQPHNILQPYQVTNYIIKARQSSGIVATVVDGLNSTSTTDALSANQGRILDEKIKPCYLVATLSTKQDNPAGIVTVQLNTVADSHVVDNKLSLQNNKIVIGSGVSFVRVNGSIFLDYPSDGYLWASIMKNDGIVAASLAPIKGDSFVSSTIPSQIISVNAGDTIWLRSDGTAADIRQSRSNTWLSVEVVY